MLDFLESFLQEIDEVERQPFFFVAFFNYLSFDLLFGLFIFWVIVFFLLIEIEG